MVRHLAAQRRRSRWRYCIPALVLLAQTSCGRSEQVLLGMVLVDGVPLESGTVHFRPAGETAATAIGFGVLNGMFTQPAGKGLTPGIYDVTVEGFKKTGRTVRDYQRGDIPEIIQLKIAGLPQRVTITKENLHDLQIELSTR